MPTSFALTVNPQEYRIADLEYDRTYQIVATVINSDLSSYDLSFGLDRDSSYLSDYVTVQDRLFKLQPNEKRNIRISLVVPKGSLSPEEHVAVMPVMSGNLKLSEFRIRFAVPGERVEKVEMISLEGADTPIDSPLYITLAIRNAGNVIARLTPQIEVFDNVKLIDRFGEDSRIMVMPGQTYNLTLMYDLSGLQYKAYTFRAALISQNSTAEPMEIKISVLPPANVRVEDHSVKQGSDLSITAKLDNALGTRSFYRVRYEIEGKDIGETLEGELDVGGKELSLKVPTSGLPVGEYFLNIETRTGMSLENLEMKRIRLSVRSHSYGSYAAGLLALGAAIALIAWKWPKARDKGSVSLRALESKLKRTVRDFDRTEKDFRQLSEDVIGFMRSSNRWLDNEYGRGRYGFK